MKRIIFILVMEVACCLVLMAQQPVAPGNGIGLCTLKGQVVVADSNIPLPKATVLLLQSKDSSIISHAISDAHGYYSLFNISPGSYIVAVSFIGYEKQCLTKTLTNFSSGTVISDLFQLKSKREQLIEVKVTARKPYTEFRNGKLVMNIDNMITASGTTIYDLLENAPYVSVNGNGTIRLNGKKHVQILIDGKHNYLPAQQLSDILKTMPASEISKIEIITIPSSKYDAAFNAGVINIITKRNQGKGINASLSSSYSLGFYPKFHGGLNVSYKRDKVRLFGSYSHSENKNNYNSYASRKLNSSAYMDHIELNEDTKVKDYYDNVRIGVDYDISERSILNIGISGYLYNRDEVDFNGTITGLNSNLISNFQTQSRLEDIYQNVSAYVYFESKPDTSGKKISIDIDHIRFDNPQMGNYTTRYYDKNGSEFKIPSLLRNTMGSGICISSFKTDYELPLPNDFAFEAGVKINFIQTDNGVRVDTLNGNVWLKDLSTSNRFQYNENINAAYVTLSKQFKSIMLRVGLRGENMQLNGYQITIDSVFRKNFTNLFPNISIEKSLNTRNVLAFALARRIKRPDYDMLNPFTYFSDPYTNTTGNPYLLPQYTIDWSLSHSYKDLLNTSVTYSRINNYFSQVSEQNDYTNVTQFRYVNLDALHELNLSVNSPLQVTKWWQSVLNLSASFTKVSSHDLLDGRLSNSIVDISVNSKNTFTINKSTIAQISGYYNMPTIDAFYTIKANYSLSLAMQKSMRDKRTVIKLGIRDVFKSQIYAGYGKYRNQDITFYNMRDTRQLYLSFIYKFGEAITPLRKKPLASNEESQRLKQ